VEVGDGITLYHIAESAVKAAFNHQIDVWVVYQLQLDLGHLQHELQHHTGETRTVHAVEFVRADYGASEDSGHVGEKEHVETEVEMMPVA